MSSDSDCQVVEESQKRKSISCENIPEIFLDKLVAKRHFSQFGRINRFILRPKRLSCTVEYESSECAAFCLLEGGVYKDQKFDIYWTPVDRGESKAIDDNIVDPDVQAELDSMAPASNRKSLNKPAPSIESFLKKTERVPAPSLVAYPKPPMRNYAPKMKFPSDIDDKIAAARQEFETLARRPALSSEDKYRVLDARDKYIRLITAKTTDIMEAKSTQGTCPDMCPEKERYMRIAKCQIASFEYAENNEMDHSVAIKQYSRSSADQESPLPHELRSEKALKMTMMYLLNQIADYLDEDRANISDWFHYVWDRTRGIRKEITQQELCSQEAVLLVEQCARFHIHCSARLIAEEPSVFDHKINTENLTKCLQSLKYMYHDLKLKGIQCPNEAEFRAYVILLNLNDGNFLWEIKQLSDNILNSVEVRFALDVYFALENNNYFKFFELLRKTTYMNACILLRYFNQVRLRALNIMLKAYTARTPSNFTISYLTHILAFEDEDSTCQFLEYYGLPCDRNNDYVYLDRKMFYYPDLPYTLDRAFHVVESKREKSVGETICGKNLENSDIFDKHSVQNSFDSNGILKEEVWKDILKCNKPKEELRDEIDNHIFKIPSPTMMSPKVVSKSPNIFQTRLGAKPESSTTISNNNTPIFGKSPAPFVAGITPIFGVPPDNIFNQPKPEQKKVENIFSKSIFGGVISQPEKLANQRNIFGTSTQPQNFFQLPKPILIPNVVEEEMKKKKEEEELARKIKEKEEENVRLQMELEKERLRIEKEEREAEVRREELKRKKKLEDDQKKIENESKKILESLIEEYVNENVKEIGTSCYNHHQLLEQFPEKYFSELSIEVVEQMVSRIVEQETFVIRKRQAKNSETMRKFFHIWRGNVYKVLDNRNKIENTPAWVPSKSLNNQVKDCFRPHQIENLQNMKRYLQGSPEVIKIPKEDANKIDLFETVKDSLLNQKNRVSSTGIVKGHAYWKLSISIPYKQEEDSSGFYYYVDKWLSNLFQRDEQQTNKNYFFLEQKAPKNYQQKLIICMRKLKGIEIVNENNQIDEGAVDNSNGIIFLMTSINLEKSKSRLHNLLQSAFVWGPVPLYIVVYNSHTENTDYFEESLDLETLIGQLKISSYEIVLHDESRKICNSSLKQLIEKSLLDMASNHTMETTLEMQSSVSFIGTCLGDEFWQRLQMSSEQNFNLFRATSNVNFILKNYNQAIERVINLAQHNFSVYPDFPDEFRQFVSKKVYDIPLDYEYFPKDWKNKKRQEQLIKFFRTLTLKPFECKQSKDLKEIQAKMNDFVKLHLGDTRRTAKIGLYMYKEFLSQFQNLEAFNETPLEFKHKMTNVNWIPILSIVTNEALQIRWSEFNSEIPNEIIYEKKEFESFSKTLWWLKQLRIEQKLEDENKKDEAELQPPELKKAKFCLKFSKTELDDILAKGLSSLEKAEQKLNKCKEITAQTKGISNALDVNLYKQEMAFRACRRTWDDSFKR